MKPTNLLSLHFKTCPRCGQTYHEPSALSRRDNQTYICPDCGTREALETLGISKAEQEQILRAIHGRRLR